MYFIALLWTNNNKNPLFLRGFVLRWILLYCNMVEAAGIEPASRKEDFKEPTCVVSDLNLRQENTH